MNTNKALLTLLIFLLGFQAGQARAGLDIAQYPLFAGIEMPPKVMLTLARDLEMFKEAYPDYSDLTGDGRLNTTYTDEFSYYGYFDPNTCYTYSSEVFTPAAKGTGPNNHYCSGSQWSGNFLNWATMTRIDVVRKILFGGFRHIDTNDRTVLQRSLLPNDGTAFAKIYDGDDLSKLTPYSGAISMCNVTWATSGRTDTLDVSINPPQLRVAQGHFPTWAATEVIQCAWLDEKDGGSPAVAHPSRTGSSTYSVRVEVCKDGWLESNCTEYPNGNLKPTGLLQEFGGNNQIEFGLITGSYEKNISGGSLRRNVGPLVGNAGPRIAENEWNQQTGIFENLADGNPNIVNAVNRLRVSHWDYASNRYDDCRGAGRRTIEDNECTSWGNPVAEMLLESIRYFSGESAASSQYFVGSSDSRMPGLPVESTWRDPMPKAEWCAVPVTIVMSTGSITHDGGINSSLGSAGDVPGITNAARIAQLTNEIGIAEGIGSNVITGGSNRQCTSETISGLSGAVGVCPNAPDKFGGYLSAGLAWHAWTNDIRPDHGAGTNVTRPSGEEARKRTFVVNLAEPLPQIELGNMLIVPTCESSARNANQWGPCSVLQTDVLAVEYDSDNQLASGRFRVFWEDSGYGNDWDMDGTSDLVFCKGSHCTPSLDSNQARITVEVTQAYAGFDLRFGFFATGTTSDGMSDWVLRPGGQNFQVIYSVPDMPERQPDPLQVVLTEGASPAVLPRNPLWYAAKWGGFDDSAGTGQPGAVDTWDTTGDGDPDNYVFSRDPRQIEERLSEILNLILLEGAQTSLATESTRLETGTFIYQASFDSEDWSGEINARDPNDGNNVVWRASETLAQQAANLGNRAERVFTYDPTAPGRGLGHLLTSSYVQERLDNLPNLPNGNYEIEDLIDYFIGDHSNEERFGGPFRNRSSILGDIVNSQLVLSGTRNEGWWRLGGNVGEDYLEFVADKVEKERQVLFVGANDGMLHAFNAKDGTPYFSYVPSAVLDNLPEYADPDYGHRFFVDGQLAVADAYLPSRGGWRTILVGAMAAGGKGIFALDVTDVHKPGSSFSATDVLWEFTDQRSNFKDDIGHVYGTPTITRMKDGTWVAIIGNGYNSKNNDAGLMVIDLQTGETVSGGFVKVDIPNDQRPATNGLAGPGLWLETGRQRHVERAYAGDLTGRIWRFQLDDGAPKLYPDFRGGSVGDGQFFHARTSAGGQAVTITPTVAASPSGGLWILFGTGKLIETSDIEIAANPPVETFYAVLDRNERVSRGDLAEVELGVDSDTGLRTAELVDGVTKPDGWFADLTTGTNSGERVLARPDILFGRVIFSTFEPIDDPCLGGGVSRIYVLNATSGQGELGSDPACPFCAGVVIPDTGAPVAPPTVIRPPTISQPGDGTTPPVPGLPPLEPVDPDDPPPLLPGDGDTGARTDWCSEFGYVNPTNLTFIPLGRVCDGRQIWRQVR